MKARYVSFFSYIGTGFRSSEKLWLKQGRNYPDTESIQGWMEIGLQKLKPLSYPNVVLSSRTDGGVHALNTSAHFDLEKFGTGIYPPELITYSLNKVFNKSDLSIFVRQCLRVGDNFSARYHALARTYLFRFAVLKSGEELRDKFSLAPSIPIEEWKRCHFIRKEVFNIERFKEGAKYLVGYHDFTTFKKFKKETKYKHSRREIYSITVQPGQPVVNSFTKSRDNVFDYWEVEIRGRAFVHNQIRRMIGTLITVATGKLEPEDVKVMLQVPSKHSWHPFISSTPAHGLYLCNIEYKPEDLIYTEQGTNSSFVDESDSENELFE